MSTSRPADAPLNPYQPPADSSPPAARAAPTGEQPETAGPLRFWEGRKALLRSIAWMRFAAIFEAVVTARHLLVWVQGMWNAFWNGELGPLTATVADTLWIATTGIYLIETAVFFISCRVLWLYGRQLREVAAQRERNPTQLCDLHLQFRQFYVASVILNTTYQLLYYFESWWSTNFASQQ